MRPRTRQTAPRARWSRPVLGPLLLLSLSSALGAGTPATNPAPGKFDNVALRTAAGETRKAPATNVAESSGIEGLDTRRVALSLAAVISLILLLRYVARKIFPQAGSGKPSAATRVLARTMVTPKQQVILLQVGRRVIVVGDCGSQMSALAEITDAEEIAALVGQINLDKAPSVAGAFGGLFRRAQKPFEQPADEPAAAAREPSDAATNSEIAGLTEKVRLLANQFRRGAI